jgi:hypothetical protein
MEAVWRIVAEDFAPFNVDVTTDDPGYEALEYSGKNDLEYGTRIVISPTDGWFAEGYGGVAYIGSFKSENTPAFVFSDNLGSFKSIGDASSHEARSHAQPPPRRHVGEDLLLGTRRMGADHGHQLLAAAGPMVAGRVRRREQR